MKNIDYIRDLNCEIEELEGKIRNNKDLIKKEIDDVSQYLNYIKNLEIWECDECGKEISYYNYAENSCLCDRCSNEY